MQAYLHHIFGVTLPEAEVRAQYNATPQGSAGSLRAPPWVDQAIKTGVQKPDYAHIKAPALAIYAVPRSAQDLAPAWVKSITPAMLDALEEEYALFQVTSKERIAAFRDGVTHSRVVELPGANHFLFISNEADVLRELQAFLAAL